MDIVGLVAEYNPFHNGHLWQIREIRRRFPGAGIVVAMSGSLAQRGSVAVLDKWKRAKSAVRHGVSLVLELPVPFATRSAQYFAGGGVRLLDRLGVVRALAFGAECDNLAMLSRMAEETDAAKKADLLRQKMRGGGSYAAALTDTAGPGAAIRQPNVILAVEYLRAIARHSARLVPVPLPRFAAAHHDLSLPPDADGTPIVASASAIRAALLSEEAQRASALCAVPADLAVLLSDDVSDTARLLRPMLARLLTVSPGELSAVAGVGEGLEHRLRRAALTARSYDELVEAVRAKRYPRARIRRILLHLLLGLSEKKARLLDEAGPLYARPLAFNPEGRKILREIATNAALPIVTKPARFLSDPKTPPLAREMLSFDLRATALASLASAPIGTPAANADFLRSPVYVQ